jgi:hypothetical protein
MASIDFPVKLNAIAAKGPARGMQGWEPIRQNEGLRPSSFFQVALCCSLLERVANRTGCIMDWLERKKVSSFAQPIVKILLSRSKTSVATSNGAFPVRRRLMAE